MSKLSSILCIGGGPGGLYFALLMKKQNPATRVTVVERKRPFDTFGWGVVFSDQTRGNAAGIQTIAVGAISEADHAWTLHEAARQRQLGQPPSVVIAPGINGEAR